MYLDIETCEGSRGVQIFAWKQRHEWLQKALEIMMVCEVYVTQVEWGILRCCNTREELYCRALEQVILPKM